MSAAELREAAALMRQRAEAAASSTGAGDWFVGSPTDDNQFATVRSSGGQVARGMTDDEAEHIASWHPAVALAVADWLEEAADHLEVDLTDTSLEICPTAHEGVECSVLDQALAVARAYLGGAS